tara:strand:- start:95 stop:640 length:546 start_codon:yes stop_codon:yes gene_type:complete
MVSKMDKKSKKGMALVISIGPKMKTKPTDAATPDMKKYGSMPMKKAFQVLKQNFKISNLPEHVRERNLPDMSPQRFMDENLHREGAKNYTREDNMRPQPSRFDDKGFPDEEDDMGPPYGKPDFGDEDAREAEMNQAERAAIMAEGVPEMQRPRSAPRPGDPRFSDPNQPRPSMPRNIFQNR